MHSLSLTALWGLLALAPAFPQTISSSLKGSAADPTGSPVPAASCRLTNRASGAVLAAQTGPDGTFTFVGLLPGAYDVQVQAGGFKTLRIGPIEISANEVRSLGQVGLELGEVRESVSVTAEVAVVQTATAERAGTITYSQINDIAIKGRDVLDLFRTLPGVVDTGAQTRETISRNALGGIFINGTRENAKNATVDGVTDLDTGSNAALHFEPNMESVAEIKVLTSNYQAEFGRNGGAVITVVTRSGTRDFHGSAYNYYRHESLNANSFFNNRTGTPKAPYRYRVTGYSLGGPLYLPGRFNKERDRLFFFFSQELSGTKVDYGSRFVNMPTELERGGNFSRSFDVNGALISARDPVSAQPFPGNVIPASRHNKMGKAMLDFHPLPNYTDPDPRNLYRWNYRQTYSREYPKRQEMVRIDANLSSSLRLFYRYVNDKDLMITPWGWWINGSINWLLSPVPFDRPGGGQVVNLTKTFSPTLVNEFIFGLSRNALHFNLEDPAKADRARVGNPAEWFPNPGVAGSYMPNIIFGGQPASPVNTGLGNLPYDNSNRIYSFVDNLNKVWGKHQIKAGIYVERTGKPQVGSANYRGQFNFSRDTNNPFDSNHSYANALLGNFQSYSEATMRPDSDYWFWNVEWYLQDNWRVSKRLTLDFGLRFYHLPPMEDRNRNIATFDPAFYSPSKAPLLYVPARDSTGRRVAKDPLTGALLPAPLIGQYVPNSGDYANGSRIGGKDGYPVGLYTSPWLGWGPRFGFAYDVFGTGRTAIRGGFGMFKDRPMGNPTFDANGNPPVAYTPTLFYGNLDTYAQGGGAIGPSNLLALFGSNKLASTMNYSLGLQHRFWNTTLDVSYVGGLSRHLINRRNINPIPMFARFDPANQDPTQPGSPLPDNFLRPYKGYGDIQPSEFASNSNYNSLQTSANRRFARRLLFGVSYTWSKALGVAGADAEALSPYFPARQRNYGPLSFDRSHVLVANYMYDLPKIGERLGWKPAGWILDGWQVSGITSFVSGAPFTPGFSTTDGQDITGSTEGARITVVGDPRLSKSEKDYFRNFRQEVFRRTPRGSFGNAGVGILRGPGVNNWDISVSKRVQLGNERRYIQFRTEMFNAWNHTQFSGLYTGARFDTAGNQTDPNFGAYSAARSPRLIQLSLRLAF